MASWLHSVRSVSLRFNAFRNQFKDPIQAMSNDLLPDLDITEDYLSVHCTARGWLLTTDHKRIGLLYLFTIIGFFAIGATAAAIMRINLLYPQGDLVLSETYNRL